MIARGARGLFFEVPTDDPKQVAGSAILRAQQDAPCGSTSSYGAPGR